ncbi:MAG: hypothetical protein QXS02_06625, partial [Candidatus Thermoplasmatota archaeon]
MKKLTLIVAGIIILFGFQAVSSSMHYQRVDVKNVNEDTSALSYESRLETGELLYWLNGTILDGNTRVIISEDGQPPQDISPDQYDTVISFEEAKIIAEEARQNYIKQYGTDPCPPDPVPPVIIPIPLDHSIFNEEMTSISMVNNIQQFNMILGSDIKMGRGGRDRGQGPHQINGRIVAKIFPAKNSRDRPNNPVNLIDKTKTALYGFRSFNNLQTIWYSYIGIWDASEVQTRMATDYDSDLERDLSSIYRTMDNQI